MDEFIMALYGAPVESIPEEYDWFAPLIGDWDFDYCDGPVGCERHVEGEWIFRRILNGTGIEDLFLCPSRGTRDLHLQPDGEYGVAIRMFNPRTKVYDMVYVCEQRMTTLTFVRASDKLIGTVTECPSEKWVFSDIRDDCFRWQNITVMGSGEWRVNATIFARRKNRNSEGGFCCGA